MCAKPADDPGLETRICRLREQGAAFKAPVLWIALEEMHRRWSEAASVLRHHLGCSLERQVRLLEGRILKSDSPTQGISQGLEPRSEVMRSKWSASLPLRAESAALDDVRAIHARVKLRQQLQASLKPSLGHAGPLHSERLVQQSLRRLQGWSEPYLHRLLGYVDALMALEDAGHPGKVASAAKPKSKSKRGN